MKQQKLQIDDSYIIRLEKGEEMIESIKNFCDEHKINSAKIFAIGAISHVGLALYELDKKEYFRKDFDGAFEIASMSGNISKFENQYVAHIHGVFSDKEFSTIAGHVDKAIVAATCEIILESYDNELHRTKSEEIGLNLIDL